MIEDLSLFFVDFGTKARFNLISFDVMLDNKDSFISADVSRFKDFDVTALAITKELPVLKSGDTLTIDSVNYKVLEKERIDDGSFTRIYLTPTR